MSEDFDSTDPASPQPGDKNQPTSHEIRHSQASALVPEHIATGVYSTGAMVFQGAHEFVLDFMMRLGKPHQLVARIVLSPTVIPSILRALQTNLDSFDRQFHPEKFSSAKTETAQPATETTGQENKISEQNVSAEPKIESEQNLGAGASAAPSTPGSSEEIVNPNPGAKIEHHDTSNQTDQSAQIEDLYGELKITPEVMSGQYANAVLIGHSANEISFDFITTFFPRSAVASRIHMAIPTARRLLDSLSQAHKQYQQRQKPPQA
ncbi:MAG: DUF3467 domain-containing protein [Planctomycetaceae bacterium]